MGRKAPRVSASLTVALSPPYPCSRFVQTFTKRRGELEFSLAIHTAVGVDAANQTLSSVDKAVQEMNAKMALMMELFAKSMPSDQKEMSRLVDKKGGAQACIDNEKILEELNAADQHAANTGAGGNASGRTKGTDLDALKDDLHEDPDTAMEQNMVVFNRKFEVQKRQIV